MVVVWLKYVDPMLWTRSVDDLYEADIEKLKPPVITTSGILIKEEGMVLILGEVTYAKDNVSLDEWGIIYPRYRNVQVIHKKAIVERKDFDV